ncbi:hypothetical protein QA601_05550 [Chitinispirillales bacterium ANBcel5]|uniref:hypothetical protein n=1 Tax=Cellulosispirillum alkaliphilum TaxID=3039283 RepID=UPI002A5533EB|nr:hypothetical protein [Chitinispirillales bacterium ANBcel5]
MKINYPAKAHLICAICLLIPLSVMSWESSEYGTMVGELFYSARSAALSGADLALSETGPLLSNAANLGRNEKTTLIFTYSDAFSGAYNNSMLQYATPLTKNSGLGVSLAYLHVPGIEDTRNIDITNIDLDNVERFSVSEIWLRVGYGHRNELGMFNLHYGGAINARRRRLEKVMGYGIGLDAGIVLSTEDPNLSLGLMVENITGNFVHWSYNYKEYSKPNVRFSFAWSRELPYVYGHLLFAYTSPDMLSNEGINKGWDGNDSEEPQQVSLREEPWLMIRAGRYGLEYSIMETVILRAGLQRGDFSMGGGVILFENKLNADFTYLTHELAGTWKMSVTYNWH